MLYKFKAPERTPDRGCVLGNARICDAKDCAGCGWHKDEIARRRRLPLWRDRKTKLWRKRVGQRDPGA